MKNLLLLLLFSVYAGSGLLAQKNLPYTTGFDTQADRDDWDEYRPGHNSLHGWTFGNAGAHSNPTCLSHDYPVGGNSDDTVRDWFTSPALNITANAKLSLWVSGFTMLDTTDVDYFGIWYSDTERDPADGGYTELADLTGLFKSGVWTDTTDIPVPSSDSAFIAIVYHATNNWVTIKVDDITISGPASSIEKPSARISVSAFPNPAHDNIHFRINKYSGTELPVLFFYNALGQEVHTQAFGSDRMNLDCKHLPAGIYHYTVMGGQQLIGRGKIVLQ